jgi:hypothetical protein
MTPRTTTNAKLRTISDRQGSRVHAQRKLSFSVAPPQQRVKKQPEGRREATTAGWHVQRGAGGDRTAVEERPAPSGGGVVEDGSCVAFVASCYEGCVTRTAICIDWAPRRRAPEQKPAMDQACAREPAKILSWEPEEGSKVGKMAGPAETCTKRYNFGRTVPQAGGASKGGGRGGRGGGRGRGGTAERAAQEARCPTWHVGQRWAAVELQRAARGMLARDKLEQMQMAMMCARLARLRGGPSCPAVEAPAAGKAGTPESESELVRSLRRELGAEVRRRSAAERQLAEARRALIAAGGRAGSGTVAWAVAATMTDPWGAAVGVEVACGCDGPQSATEAGTQTQDGGVGVSAETQTEGQGVEVGAPAGGAGTTGVVVGRQLHPFRARAAERAELTVTRLEELSAKAEAAATRYAPTPAPTAPTAVVVPAPARTGGRQVRKEQARRRAAASGMDTREWTRADEERRRVEALMRARVQDERQEWLAMGAEEDGRDWRARLEEHLQEGQREWLRRQALPQLPGRGAYVGEENAQRSFLQAAQAAAISVREAAT